MDWTQIHDTFVDFEVSTALVACVVASGHACPVPHSMYILQSELDLANSSNDGDGLLLKHRKCLPPDVLQAASHPKVLATLPHSLQDAVRNGTSEFKVAHTELNVY